jgi:hypothetical protein
MQHSDKQGHGYYVFCKAIEESNLHLFRLCPYTCHIWKEIGDHMGMGHVSENDSIVDRFEELFTKNTLKHFQVVPILVSWGLWLARNASLFEGKSWPTIKVI